MCCGLVRHRGDLVAVLDRVEEEHADDRERRQRVEHLERQVVPRLPGSVLVAPAVPHDDPQDQAPDQHADDQGGDPGADPEAPDGLGPVRCALGQAESFPLLCGLPPNSRSAAGCRAPLPYRPAGVASPDVWRRQDLPLRSSTPGVPFEPTGRLSLPR